MKYGRKMICQEVNRGVLSVRNHRVPPEGPPYGFPLPPLILFVRHIIFLCAHDEIERREK
jgi:hypothetical protein